MSASTGSSPPTSPARRRRLPESHPLTVISFTAGSHPLSYGRLMKRRIVSGVVGVCGLAAVVLAGCDGDDPGVPVASRGPAVTYDAGWQEAFDAWGRGIQRIDRDHHGGPTGLPPELRTRRGSDGSAQHRRHRVQHRLDLQGVRGGRRRRARRHRRLRPHRPGGQPRPRPRRARRRRHGRAAAPAYQRPRRLPRSGPRAAHPRRARHEPQRASSSRSRPARTSSTPTPAIPCSPS